MKKGFTLIEILAVIVILAIIVIIAVPKILGVIETVKKEAVDDDVRLIVDTVKKKKAVDDTFNYTDITEDNIEDVLGIAPTNYADLSISDDDGEPDISIVGKNKYNGLVACGTLNDLLIANSNDSSACQKDTGPMIYHVTETTYDYQPATTMLEMDDDDDGAGAIDFNFTFGETTYLTLYVSTNGYITFNEDDAYEYNNKAISSSLKYPIIAGYWTDLILDNSVTLDQGIYYTKGTDNGKNYLLVEYRNICDLWADDCDDASTGSFEIKLYEDGEFYVYYKDLNFGESDYNNGGNGTTGVYVNSTNYAKYSYNTPIIDDGLALKYYLAPGTIDIGPCFGFYQGTITSYNPECPKDVVIPKTIDGVDVTTIGESAFEDAELTSVTIPDSVTAIEQYAFYNDNLTALVIPDSVNTIEYDAFAYNQLTSVTIPNSVTTIEAGAFKNNELTSVTIPGSVTTIGNNAFYCNELTSVVISNGVNAIGTNAFAYNELTSINIPNSVTTIGITAFIDNYILQGNAIIDNSINRVSIGFNAFAYNESNGRITITPVFLRAAEAIAVAESCFTFDSDTGTITDYDATSCVPYPIIPSTIGGVAVQHLGYNSFYDKQLLAVSIPNSVTSIENGAFQQNQLTSIVIPNSVTSIEDWAFFFNSLTSASISSNVTSIGVDAFAWNKLTSVTIPNGVTSIEDSVFSGNKLTSVIIPNGVTSIGYGAFDNNELTSVTLPNGIKSIAGGAFQSNKLTSITIPNSVTDIENAAFNDNQLPNNQAFIYARNSNGTVDTTTIVSYGGANRSNVVIPSGTVTLFVDAFANNQLTGVTIPNSVTTICIFAFAYNQLTSITLPNSVTVLAANAFEFNQLTSLTIPNSLTYVSYEAFQNNQISSLTLGSGVTTIYDMAFGGNLLTSLYIPHNVTNIMSWAFSYNNIKQGNLTIDNSSGNVSIVSNAFSNNGDDYNTNVTPIFLR